MKSPEFELGRYKIQPGAADCPHTAAFFIVYHNNTKKCITSYKIQ
jgi:hypothetical protein